MTNVKSLEKLIELANTHPSKGVVRSVHIGITNEKFVSGAYEIETN